MCFKDDPELDLLGKDIATFEEIVMETINVLKSKGCWSCDCGLESENGSESWYKEIVAEVQSQTQSQTNHMENDMSEANSNTAISDAAAAAAAKTKLDAEATAAAIAEEYALTMAEKEYLEAKAFIHKENEKTLLGKYFKNHSKKWMFGLGIATALVGGSIISNRSSGKDNGVGVGSSPV